MSPKHIQEMLSGDGRYDVEILAQLETFLEEQLDKATYDLEANLAILKLYLLYPEQQKPTIYEGILIKALMAFPNTDFSLCMYQIPEKHHGALKQIEKLAQCLEMAKFKAFWKAAEEQVTAAKESEGGEAQGISRAKGWQDAVRRFVCGVVNSTYRSIRKDQLAALLNMEVKDLAPAIKENSWVESKEDKEVIIVREQASFDNGPAEPKASTTMSLDMYRQLFMASSGA
jgi:translation initiation factor 3 subunit K